MVTDFTNMSNTAATVDVENDEPIVRRLVSTIGGIRLSENTARRAHHSALAMKQRNVSWAEILLRLFLDVSSDLSHRLVEVARLRDVLCELEGLVDEPSVVAEVRRLQTSSLGRTLIDKAELDKLLHLLEGIPV